MRDRILSLIIIMIILFMTISTMEYWFGERIEKWKNKKMETVIDSVEIIEGLYQIYPNVISIDSVVGNMIFYTVKYEPYEGK